MTGALQDLARQALAHWGGRGEPQLVWRSENTIFRAELPGGDAVALRLHRPGYQDFAGIETELDWCARLAAQKVAVATPLPADDGRLVIALGDQLASCVRWLDGAPLGDADAPLVGSAVLSRTADVGALIADLHNATDAGACPVCFERPGWTAEALLGDDPRWGRFWEHPALAPDERSDLLDARALARKMIVQATDFGPIHADVIRGNVMVTLDGLVLIDFDDSGPGWRLYDLASALIQSWGDPLMGAQAEALVEGYRSRRALPEDQAALLPLFVALRGFASAGWIVTRVAQDDPRQRRYVGRAVSLARDLLAGRVPWDRGAS